MALVLPDSFQRLPVYLLIDTSASMAGAPVTAVSEGLQMFQRILVDDPHCRESAHIGIIGFSSDAQVLTPLTPATEFTPPEIVAGGGSALSRGLHALKRAIRQEVKPKSPDHPGDYKPLIFVLTDGDFNPGDPWREQSSLLFTLRGPRPGLLVAIGTGPNVNAEVLRELAPDLTYLLADLDASRVRALFQWIGYSTVVASRTRLQPPGTGNAHRLAPAPPNLFEREP